MNDLVVTIRCLVYNHEPYLRQCLEGFVMQKTNFRFEAIVHDDASTDNSAAIIREYAEKYPDIIKPIFETENQYSKRDGSLRRIMNAHTHGKYVAICEGDDYWIDPFKLQKQVDIMETNPDYSLCFHNAVVFYEGISKLPEIFNNLIESHVVSLKEITDSWIVPTASMLYRREILENYPEWTSQIYSGDFTLQLIAFSKGKIFYINQIMSFYRKAFDNANSLSVRFANNYMFVASQQILLLELYNKHTDFKFTDILQKRIDYLKKDTMFLRYRQINIVYALVRMPIFFVKKLYRRFCK